MSGARAAGMCSKYLCKYPSQQGVTSVGWGMLLGTLSDPRSTATQEETLAMAVPAEPCSTDQGCSQGLWSPWEGLFSHIPPYLSQAARIGAILWLLRLGPFWLFRGTDLQPQFSSPLLE